LNNHQQPNILTFFARWELGLNLARHNLLEVCRTTAGVQFFVCK
jgi:hypothetical protein